MIDEMISGSEIFQGQHGCFFFFFFSPLLYRLGKYICFDIIYILYFPFFGIYFAISIHTTSFVLVFVAAV